MMNNGESSRMAMIGLNEGNTDYVVRAIHDTLTSAK